MAVSFVTRFLILVLGYAYPAYSCYKTLERTEHLRFWCQYWILLAFLTAVERVADRAVSWLPLYAPAKIALVVYLWHPNTMGATHLYDGYLRPFLARHEADVDRAVLELRARARVAAASAASLARAWVVEAVRGSISSQAQGQGRPGPGRAAGTVL